MQELLDLALRTLRQQRIGDLLGPLIVWAALLLLILLLTVPLFLLRKRRGYGGPFVTFQVGSGQVDAAPSTAGQSMPGHVQGGRRDLRASRGTIAVRKSSTIWIPSSAAWDGSTSSCSVCS